MLLSCAIGDALYPHPQWQGMARTWKTLYPVTELSPERQREFAVLEQGIGPFVRMLVEHRSPALQGRSLRESFPTRQRRPARLLELYDVWGNDLGALARQPPSLVFAVIGQARAAGRLTPEQESTLLSALLEAWAVRTRLLIDEQTTQPSKQPLIRAS